jgi:hypothetical protein
VRAERRRVRQAEVVALAHVVAELATHREIRPTIRPIADRNVRKTLGYIIRCWHAAAAYTTADAALAERPHREHVVPVRVLVERIIMQPADAERLLNECVVIAHVTPQEHKRLASFYRQDPEYQGLYPEMLTAPIENLVDLGHQRYIRRGIKLRELAPAPSGRSRGSA